MRPTASGRPEAPFAAALHRAAHAGLITEDQAEAVITFELGAPEAVPSPRATRVPPVLEALGYLGAVLLMVGAVSLVAGFWEDLRTWSRLAILGVTAAALTATGLGVHGEADDVLARLRGFVLLLASGAVAGFVGVLVVDGFDVRDEPVALSIGAAIAGHAGLLWRRRDRPAQHLACLAGLVMAMTAGLVWAGAQPQLVGAALWVGGAAWLTASQRRLLPPAYLGMAFGAALGLAGAGVVNSEWRHVGVLFGLATAAGVVAAGIRLEEFLVTVVGVIGAFVYLPSTLTTFFGDTIGAPAVLSVSGLALLGLTVLLLRRRGGDLMAGGGWSGRPRHA